MNDALEQITEEIPAALQQFVEVEDKPVDTPKDDVVDAPVEQKQEQQQEQANPLVEKAKKGGWTDLDTWKAAGKDPDEWIDAKEFVGRQPLYERQHKQAKKIQDLEEKLKATAEFATKAQEVGYKKAMAELEARRIEAVETGDVESFNKVEKEIQEIKEEYAPILEPETKKPEPKQEEIPAPVKDFAERNKSWFEKDEDMTVLMVAKTQKHTAAGVALEKALELAESEVKKAFAHKFVNPKKDEPAAVASGSREARAKTFSYNDLSQEQKQVWSVLKNSGMKIDKFIKDLVEAGDLK